MTKGMYSNHFRACKWLLESFKEKGVFENRIEEYIYYTIPQLGFRAYVYYSELVINVHF